MIRNFKDLEVYQISYRLALEIHQITRSFPGHETYEIGSQLRRAALSVPLNIAEGCGKKESVKDFKRFLNISLGSCNETMVLIDFAKDLKYIEPKQHEEYIEQYQVLAKRIYTMMEKWN